MFRRNEKPFLKSVKLITDSIQFSNIIKMKIITNPNFYFEREDLNVEIQKNLDKHII